MLKNNQGFSVIEVLIAITILAIGLLAVATMQITSMEGNSFSRGMTEALSAGQSQMESLLSLEYDHSDLNDGAHGPKAAGRYQIDWNVNEGASLPDTKDLAITVSWQGKQGPRQLVITTTKADLI